MFTFRRPSSFAVAPEWGEAQAEKARKVFDEFDRDSNQKIDYKELVPALKEYGVELPENVQAIDFVLAYDGGDGDADGALQYPEFEALVRDLTLGSVKTATAAKERMSKANLLAKTDADNGGVSAMNPVMLFASADADGSGMIDIDEFSHLHGIIVKETEARIRGSHAVPALMHASHRGCNHCLCYRHA